MSSEVMSSPSSWLRLEKLASVAQDAGVWRSSLAWGDRVTIFTRNSVYRLIALDGGAFIVSGGWFDRQNMSPAVVQVNGCTSGGSAINRNLIAAPGLHLELGSRVTTTEIQRVIVDRFEAPAEVA